MTISKRLKTVADCVDKNSYIIDVGCDHALLDIYLIKQNINIKAIASDNKEGPFERALENINKYHLEKEIKVTLGDGLDPITKDVNTIVISGMGGQNMIGIFKKHLEVLSHIDTIILSPNNDTALIRRFLVNHGYKVEQEIMVEDKNIIYSVLKFKKGSKFYNKKELYFGPIFLREKSKLFQSYWQKEIKRKNIALQLMPKKYILKRNKLKKEIKAIEKVLGI